MKKAIFNLRLSGNLVLLRAGIRLRAPRNRRPRRAPRPPLAPAAELAEARRLYLAGWAAVRLGGALLLGRRAIRDALTRAGLSLPPEDEPPPRAPRPRPR